MSAPRPARKCGRCGGTGRYSKGMIVNGTCYGCMGTGVTLAPTRGSGRVKVVQYALINALGHHLAVRTSRADLEALNLPGAVGIEELAR